MSTPTESNVNPFPRITTEPQVIATVWEKDRESLERAVRTGGAAAYLGALQRIMGLVERDLAAIQSDSDEDEVSGETDIPSPGVGVVGAGNTPTELLTGKGFGNGFKIDCDALDVALAEISTLALRRPGYIISGELRGIASLLDSEALTLREDLKRARESDVGHAELLESTVTEACSICVAHKHHRSVGMVRRVLCMFKHRVRGFMASTHGTSPVVADAEAGTSVDLALTVQEGTDIPSPGVGVVGAGFAPTRSSLAHLPPAPRENVVYVSEDNFHTPVALRIDGKLLPVVSGEVIDATFDDTHPTTVTATMFAPGLEVIRLSAERAAEIRNESMPRI